MEYYKILKLAKEPFSNSPDPEYFFQSRQHVECLQKLELALRLRRGLNVVIGAVGTGKTTLCRQLIRKFSTDDDVETHLVLDPNFGSTKEFLETVAQMITGTIPENSENDWQIKEVIKQALFQEGVSKNKTVILIIDEGQKIPIPCLEILREFLNYETNEYKLLQIAIFAQTEFETILRAHENFADRVNVKHHLGPMNFSDTREMIRFRLKQSAQEGRNTQYFTFPALWNIYRATGGYPRKIIHLCHRATLAMIIQNKKRIGSALVRSCAERDQSAEKSWKRMVFTAAALVGITIVLMALIIPRYDLLSSVITDPVRHDKLTNTNAPAKFAITPDPEKTPPVAAVPEPLPPSLAKPDVTDSEQTVSAPAPVETAAISYQTLKPSDMIKTDLSEPATVGIGPLSASENQERPGGDLLYTQPEILGVVTLQNRETLWKLTEKVYGYVDREYLNGVRKANPKIKNPKRVYVGDRVTIPAIPAKVNARPEDTWWIKVYKIDDLNTAIDFLRNYPEGAPAVRIISHWNPTENLKFTIVQKKFFNSMEAAKLSLAAFPAPLDMTNEFINQWPEGTVFYSDPWQK